MPARVGRAQRAALVPTPAIVDPGKRLIAQLVAVREVELCVVIMQEVDGFRVRLWREWARARSNGGYRRQLRSTVLSVRQLRARREVHRPSAEFVARSASRLRRCNEIALRIVSNGSMTNRGSIDTGPPVGVSVMRMVLQVPSGSTWISTLAMPVGRKRTSSTRRRGGSRSRTFEKSWSSAATVPSA